MWIKSTDLLKYGFLQNSSSSINYFCYQNNTLYLARLILAFCPPLKETPLSPTNVLSPSENNLRSYIKKKNIRIYQNAARCVYQI